LKKPTVALTPREEREFPVKISFDPLAVKTAETSALAQLNDLQGATIDNDAELEQFSALLVETTRERKLIEAMRAETLAPIKTALKVAEDTVDKLFNFALTTKQASETKLRELVGGYQQAKAEAARQLRAAAAKAAQERNPEALTKALVASNQVAPGKLAGVGVKEVWVATIKASDLVPYEWCVPDEKRINKHARETPIEQTPAPIPGVIFTREARTTVR
jgi:hypothetical protein